MNGNILPEKPVCVCGCYEIKKNRKFIPKDDLRLYRAIVQHVGGVSNLRDIIERVTGAVVDP
ncbi:hypothetical protein MNBD_GAMMA09-2838 [hydrothermal vent metagenome]|uniref:Uncharacterized protein n=1 Tax=hydrothermal vent metagenome TaxID=652676 RepID=A0A3B0XWQ2_9ZZZZ